MRPATLLFLASLAITSQAWSADPPNEALDRIKASLKTAYPATEFREVRPTPLPGIYEVSMGRNVAYVGSDTRHFLFGHLYDIQAQRDLTAEHLDEARRIDFASLPLGDAIRTVRGDGTRRIAVFSDPECPYCKGLEQELAKLDNVTIHTFLYPLDELHPEARAKAIAVWCAQDRAAAWKGLMLDGKAPKSAACDHPIDRNIQLAHKLGVEGTPALFDVRGRRLAGAAPAQRIETFLAAEGQLHANGEKQP